MIVRALALALALVGMSGCDARSAGGGPSPLVLERTIPLAGVSGRIDHLAVDPAHHRLFVAELGAGSVEAIDLASGRSLGRIGGLQEPQGVGYLPGQDELAVATGGDGMVRFYKAGDLTPVGSLKLGTDADDVRVGAGRLYVGYGQAMAVIDPAARRLLAAIALPAHPEGFEVAGGRAYVNLPEAGGLAVLDLAAGRQLARWPNPEAHFNFPLAVDGPIDGQPGRVASVYRLPARLALFEPPSGKLDQKLETCGDADDVFFDGRRRRIYVVCGGGSVDVFQAQSAGYVRSARVPTRGGARTGFYSPELDRLYVAARAGSAPAAILVYRPV